MTPKFVMANPPPEISRVAAKLPPFWKTDPIVWFIQVEAQFAISGITQDETKYNTVIANVDSSILGEVSDLLIAPPNEQKYDAIKTRLIRSFADSEERKLKTLLQDIELGDKKPSSLLKEMRQLAGTRISESVLKSLWLNRLPNTMQPVLTVLDVTLTNLADAADKLVDTLGSHQVNAVSNDARTTMNDYSELKAEIEALSRKLDSQNRRRSRSRSRSNYRHQMSYGDKCFYHAKFGMKAFKCSGPPCKMANSEN